MTTIDSINKLRGKVTSVAKKYKSILSIYVYAGFLYNTKNFKDIDLLILLKNSENPELLLSKLDSELRSSIKEKIDTNYVFQNELNRNLAGQKSNFYYTYIYRTGRLLYGKDSLGKTEPSKEELYRWIVLLAQRARHFYYNGLETVFWVPKFKKWTIYALAETYYHQRLDNNKIKADLRIMAKEFIVKNENFKEGQLLFQNYPINAKYYLTFLEKLRIFIEIEILKIPQ